MCVCVCVSMCVCVCVSFLTKVDSIPRTIVTVNCLEKYSDHNYFKCVLQHHTHTGDYTLLINYS